MITTLTSRVNYTEPLNALAELKGRPMHSASLESVFALGAFANFYFSFLLVIFPNKNEKMLNNGREAEIDLRGHSKHETCLSLLYSMYSSAM